MIDLFTLKRLVQKSAEAGVAEYLKKTQPQSDRIKKREAYRWFRAMGLKQSLLDELVDDGIVTQERVGSGKNSPLFLSKSDVMQALVSKELATFIL